MSRKKACIYFMLVVIIWQGCLKSVSAANREVDLSLSRDMYVAAASCMAAYNSRVGILALRYLREDGWNINSFIRDNSVKKINFFIASKEKETGAKEYLLSFRGTDGTAKTIEADFQVTQVPFHSAKDSKNIKVHKGFNNYAQQAVEVLSRKNNDGVSLIEVLQQDPAASILLTGHSLGGAAATIFGARLIDMGISADQIRVITFGAPAVGNDSFGQQYQPQINLTRVIASHDIIPTILQKIVGGYVQFGKEEKINVSLETAVRQHNMVLYLDYAIKMYYNGRQTVADDLNLGDVKSGLVSVSGQQANIIVLPIVFHGKTTDKKYLNSVIWESYQKMYSSNNVIFVDGYDENVAKISNKEIMELAKKKCAKYAVFTEVNIDNKRKEDEQVVTLAQGILDLNDNKVVRMTAFSSVSDYELSVLQATIHNCYKMIIDYRKDEFSL